jgi:hypothetical protein
LPSTLFDQLFRDKLPIIHLIYEHEGEWVMQHQL